MRKKVYVIEGFQFIMDSWQYSLSLNTFEEVFQTFWTHAMTEKERFQAYLLSLMMIGKIMVLHYKWLCDKTLQTLRCCCSWMLVIGLKRLNQICCEWVPGTVFWSPVSERPKIASVSGSSNCIVVILLKATSCMSGLVTSGWEIAYETAVETAVKESASTSLSGSYTLHPFHHCRFS